MKHGYYSDNWWYTFGMGNSGTMILLSLLILIVAAFITFIKEQARKRKDPEYNRLLGILKEKYSRNETGIEEYEERYMLLKDEYRFTSDNPAMLVLNEQYVQGEIDSRNYVKRKEELKNGKARPAMDILNERYARGEISSEEYQIIKHAIQ